MVRIGLGVCLFGYLLFGDLPSINSTLMVLGIGGIALVTGTIGFCPAWKFFGIDTCSHKKSHAEDGTKF